MRDITKHPGYKYVKLGHGSPFALIRWQFCWEKTPITGEAIERVMALPGFPLERNAAGRPDVGTMRLFAFLKKHNAKVRRLLGLPKGVRT